ncbi:MAG: DsbC family protein [Porticoccus sp.]
MNLLILRSYILAAFSLLYAAVPVAAEGVSSEIAKKITDTLKASRPDLKFGKVEKTKIQGLYLIRVNATQSLYVGETGEYAVAGDMYHVKPGQFAPVVPRHIIEMRKNKIDAIALDDVIAFPSLTGKTKAIIYVFTDVDCHFCQKFHNETLPDLSMRGVEVRYLAYPRAGIGSDSYQKMTSAWCASDKKTALSALKNGETISENDCNENPITDQYDLGQEIGITGTPAILLGDGTLLMGYRSAKDLLSIIGVE